MLRSLLLVASMSVLGSSSATLIDRGGGLIYDDVLNITWVQDASLCVTLNNCLNRNDGFLPGGMTWADANSWAANLVYGGYNDWRLPTGSTASPSTIAYDCSGGTAAACGASGNELGYMYYFNLGGSGSANKTGNQTSALGGVQLRNIQFTYWSSTESSSSARAWHVYFDHGDQSGLGESIPLGAWAVRTGDVASGLANYQGMWAVPNLAEGGWGINFTHQGDVIFVSWFTYDANGKPQWFSMTALVQPDGSYVGSIDATTGPPYSAVPYDPTGVTHTTVGTGRLAFTDANNGTFQYTLNGISQVKPLARFVFAAPVPVCTFNGALAATQAVNYTDMWAVPNLAEAGWGINFTHQGDVIFASWFIYDQNGAPFWVSATLIKTAAGIYTGALDMTTGPPFSAVPYNPSLVTHTTVGTATVVFTDGNNGTFTYTLNGVTRIKALTRFVFRAPGTVCQ